MVLCCWGCGCSAARSKLRFCCKPQSGQAAPEQGVGQAYLTAPVQRQTAVIPHLMTAVPHQAAGSFDACYPQTTECCLQAQGAFPFAGAMEQLSTASASHSHADVRAPAPAKLYQGITQSTNDKRFHFLTSGSCCPEFFSLIRHKIFFHPACSG